jgi:hypothetical protein
MNVGDLVVRIGADLSGLKKGMADTERAIAPVRSRLLAVGAAATAAFAAGAGAFAVASVRAWNESAKAIAGVESRLKSTAGAAGFTSAQLQEMAARLQDVTTFGDDEILSGVTQQLLTFSSVVGPTFDRAQKAALDLSTVLGQSLQSSAIQLGKALQDPIQGVTALRRVGISFSEAQLTTIKRLQETNRLADAQAVILAEVERQYGGAAQAAAKAGTGPLKQLANAFNDLQEVIGGVVFGALTPFIGAMADAVKSAQKFFTSLQFDEAKTKITTTMGEIIAQVKGGFANMLDALQVFAAAFTGDWQGMWDNINAITERSLAHTTGVVVEWGKGALENFKRLGKGFVDGIRGGFREGLNELKQDLAGFFSGGFQGIVNGWRQAVLRGFSSGTGGGSGAGLEWLVGGKPAGMAAFERGLSGAGGKADAPFAPLKESAEEAKKAIDALYEKVALLLAPNKSQLWAARNFGSGAGGGRAVRAQSTNAPLTVTADFLRQAVAPAEQLGTMIDGISTRTLEMNFHMALLGESIRYAFADIGAEALASFVTGFRSLKETINDVWRAVRGLLADLIQAVARAALIKGLGALFGISTGGFGSLVLGGLGIATGGASSARISSAPTIQVTGQLIGRGSDLVATIGTTTDLSTM